MDFEYTLNFKEIDFRQHPEHYRIGKGEQGVLLVEPYKGEILPHWRFKTPEIAQESADKIYEMFLEYGEVNDFVGMDMARKFLQMGYTRSRRYANHKSGRKWSDDHSAVLPRQEDLVKAESATIFRVKWLQAKQNTRYLELMQQHRQLYEEESPPISTD